MEKSIEKILSQLVNRTANHFNLGNDEALAIVAQSRLANELTAHGNIRNLVMEDMCAELFEEIAKGE